MRKIIGVFMVLIFLAGCALAACTRAGVTQPAPTSSSTTTLTSTPDTRSILGDLSAILLSPEDLPESSAYFLPDPDWMKWNHNSDVLKEWGTDEGQKYLDRTKRVDGMWISFKRGSETEQTPDQVFCDVTEFETAEGASITINEFNPLVSPNAAVVTYLPGKENYPNLGDSSLTYYYQWKDDSGESYIIYYIDAVYVNYLVNCGGYGKVAEVSPDFIANLVSIMLEKIKTAPLGIPDSNGLSS